MTGMNLVQRADVMDCLLKLYTAFPTHQGMKNRPEETAEVYRESMGAVSLEALRAATTIVIRNDAYFPKVARLLEVALDWTKRHRADFAPELKNPLWCARCGTEARWRSQWRPKVQGPRSELVLSEDGVYVQLEQIELLRCQCAAVPPFEPEPDVDGPWMLREKIVRTVGGQAMKAKVRRPDGWTEPAGLLPATTESTETAVATVEAPT